MTRPPISYRVWRVVLLVAVFGAVYLVWSIAVDDWLTTADGWIAAVAEWVRGLNPLD